jgi:hypothetical protein
MHSVNQVPVRISKRFHFHSSEINSSRNVKKKKKLNISILALQVCRTKKQVWPLRRDPELPRLLLAVDGAQIPLFDASRNAPLTQYSLLTAEIQGFAESDKVYGSNYFFIRCQSWND